MQPTFSSKKRGSLRDLAYVVFRRKWVILGVLLSAVIPVTIHTLRIPSTYQARASVLVQAGRENIYLSPVGAPVGALPPTITQRVAELINSEIEIIKTRALLKRVIEAIGVTRLFPDKDLADVQAVTAQNREPVSIEVAVNRASRNLVVSRIRDTDVINIGFRSYDPQVAADFVNAVLDEFLERHLEIHQSTQNYEFFRAQSNQLEQRLKSAARELADFRKRYGITSFDQLKSITLQQYSDMSLKKMESEGAIERSRRKIEILKEQLSQLPEQAYASQSEGSDSGTTDSFRLKLTDLELKKIQLMNKYKPSDWRIAGLDEVIAKVKEALASEEEKFHGSVSTGRNPIRDSLKVKLLSEEAALEVLQMRPAEIEKKMAVYGQELDRLSRLEPQLRALQRAVGIHEQNYKLYLTKFEESRVSDAMDAAKIVSISVLEQATPPTHPIPVKKRLNIFVAVCLGGIAGLGLAFLLEYLDHSLKVPEDVEESLGVRLLSTIDDLRVRRKEDIDSLVASPKVPLYYQTLKSNFVMLAKEKGMKSFCVCSPTAREGASYVSLNLAGAIAKDNGQRVIWIDSNLRHPYLNGVFNLPVSPGFGEVIQEGIPVDNAVHEPISSLPNLVVLSSGVPPPNSTAVFESPKLAELIELLKKKFDWVIFDGAPADEYPDSIVLARQVDGIILVVQAENTDAEVAIRVKNNLERSGGTVVGAVLNRRRHVIPEFIYRRL